MGIEKRRGGIKIFILDTWQVFIKCHHKMIFEVLNKFYKIFIIIENFRLLKISCLKFSKFSNKPSTRKEKVF
jgi:hypothetical protein